MTFTKPDHQAAYCGVPYMFYDVDGAPQEYVSDRSWVEAEVGAPAADAYQCWAEGRPPSYTLDERMLNKLSAKAQKLLALLAKRMLPAGMRVVVYTSSSVVAAALRQLLTLCLGSMAVKANIALYLGRRWTPRCLKPGVSSSHVHYPADDIRALRQDVQLLFAHTSLLDVDAPPAPRGAVAVLFDWEAHVNLSISAQKRLQHAAVHVFRIKDEHAELRPPLQQSGKRPRTTQRALKLVDKEAVTAPVCKKAPHDDMHYQHVPRALRGPGVGDVGYIYGLALPPEKATPDPFQSSGSASQTSNAVRFAVVLSTKLDERDRTLCLSDIGYDVDEGVGNIDLLHLGTNRWKEEDLTLARSWHKSLFSTITSTKVDAFQWQSGEYFSNYLVVPVVEDDGAYHVDFGSMLALANGDAGSEPHSSLPKHHLAVQRHVEKVQGTLVLGPICKNSGERLMFLTGRAKYDVSPITPMRLKWGFHLDSNGAMKNTHNVLHLVNAIEIADVDGIVPYTYSFPDPECPSNPQRFDPKRNREKERSRWYGDIMLDIERKCGGGVNALHQPLISTLWLRVGGGRMPIFDMATLCRLLSGTPLREVMADVVEEANAHNAYPDHLQVPEKLQPHPHFAPHALFLPAILMCLRRHLELCELRSLILRRNGQNVRLALLSHATTTPQVDPKQCYERMEFLGDSILKAVATLHVFIARPLASEGVLHENKLHFVTNEALARYVTNLPNNHGIHLMSYLRTAITSVKRWTPSGAQQERSVIRMHDKLPADVIEALCAAVGLVPIGDDDSHTSSWPMLLKLAFQVCTRFLHCFGPVPKDRTDHDKELLKISIRTLHGDDGLPHDAFPVDNREGVAKRVDWARRHLNYDFRHTQLLLVALTAKCYSQQYKNEQHALLFERLEHLGDSLVGFVLSISIFQAFPDDSPGELTALLALAVSNDWNLARIAAHHRLDEQLYIASEVTQKAVNRNAEKRRRRAANRTKIRRRHIPKAPKILYDALEAVLGAVWVDGGLQAACRVAHHVLGETVTLLEQQLYERCDEMHVRRDIYHETRGICEKAEAEEPGLTSVLAWRCTITVCGVEIGSDTASSKKHAQEQAYVDARARLKGNDRNALLVRIRTEMCKQRPKARLFGGG